jgi:hypothetical protein
MMGKRKHMPWPIIAKLEDPILESAYPAALVRPRNKTRTTMFGHMVGYVLCAMMLSFSNLFAISSLGRYYIEDRVGKQATATIACAPSEKAKKKGVSGGKIQNTAFSSKRAGGSG